MTGAESIKHELTDRNVALGCERRNELVCPIVSGDAALAA